MQQVNTLKEQLPCSCIAYKHSIFHHYPIPHCCAGGQQANIHLELQKEGKKKKPPAEKDTLRNVEKQEETAVAVLDPEQQVTGSGSDRVHGCAVLCALHDFLVRGLLGGRGAEETGDEDSTQVLLVDSSMH